MISQAELIELARGLKSEHGENPEYDRALVELCTDALGMSMDERHKVARMIGVKHAARAIGGESKPHKPIFAMVGWGFHQAPEHVQREFAKTLKKLAREK
jgi:hypothetical protein